MTSFQPLRYQISDWHQLPSCKSNTSRDLHIHVTDFIQDHRLSGFRISIVHDEFGTLFACVLQAHGSLIQLEDEGVTKEFTAAEILGELRRYGFLVKYNPVAALKGAQVSYLMNLQSLKFDKLRILDVYKYQSGARVFNRYIVAFNVDKNPYWLNNDYAAPESEFLDALKDGSAMNLSAISETAKFDWSWLYGFVASIDDVLRENAYSKSQMGC